MAVFVEDHFTRASDAALSAHTPDTVGTSWVEEINTSGQTVNVLASSDNLDLTGTQAAVQIVFTPRPAPASADYSVELTTVSVPSDSDDPHGPVVRYNAGDMYFAPIYRASNSNDKRLYKVVSGVRSLIAQSDSGLANGDKVRLTANGTALDVDEHTGVDWVNVISTSDSAISGAGFAGLGWGNIGASTEDVNNITKIDDFIAQTLAAGGTVETADKIPVASDAKAIAQAALPVESLAAVTNEPTLDVAWHATPRASFSVPIDLRAETLAALQMLAEHAATQFATARLAADIVARIERGEAMPAAWAGAIQVVHDAALPIEIRRTTEAGDTLPTDFTQTLIVNSVIPADFGVGIVADGLAAIDWLAGVGMDARLAASWRRLVQGGGRAMPAEWSQAVVVASDAVVPIDWQAFTTAGFEIPAEWKGLGFIDGNVNVFGITARGTVFRALARAGIFRPLKH